MQRYLLAALLLPAAFAGCVGHGCSEGGPWTSAWDHAGLWDALAEPRSQAGIEVRHVPPPPGLPFASAALEGRWGSFSLVSVVLSRPNTPAVEQFILKTDGIVTARYDESVDEATLRDWFKAFVDDATGLPPDRVAILTDAFITSRTPAGEVIQWEERDGTTVEVRRLVHVYQGNVEAPYRLDALFQDVMGDTFPDAGKDWERPTLMRDGWTFEFRLATREARSDGPSGPAALSVDVAGHARFRLENSQSDDRDGPQHPHRDEAVRRLDALVTGLSLPPMPDGARDVHGMTRCN